MKNLARLSLYLSFYTALLTVTASGAEQKGADDPPPLPKGDIPTIGADLFDGFEGPDSTVWAFDSADDEAVGQYIEDGATQGKKALKLTLRGRGKKGKIQ